MGQLSTSTVTPIPLCGRAAHQINSSNLPPLHYFVIKVPVCVEYFQAFCIIDGAIKRIELVFSLEISTREIVNEEFLMIITDAVLFIPCLIVGCFDTGVIL